jgi:KamA family protein
VITLNWKEIYEPRYQNGNDLKEILHLSDQEVAALNKITEEYPMLTNKYYLSLIDPDDPADPIRKMSVPSLWELEQGGDSDTSGEKSNTVMTGMQHKYSQTALMLSTNECFMYCRHCFRKRMVGVTDTEVASQLAQMKEYLLAHPSVNNILISGGDSFFNSNARIAQYLETFTALDQLDFIRFGTRVPVVLPQRISQDKELLDILKKYNEKKQIYVVTQFNHPRELTPESNAAIQALKEIGIIIKNQTVLLKEINDSADVLGELLSKLTISGVVPYYIFQCRPVRGVLNHFQVPLLEGCKIVDGAKSMQNGQGKCVRYAMSHPTGKIEIIGELSEGEMIFKYHQAKDPKDSCRIFTQKLTPDQCWL